MQARFLRLGAPEWTALLASTAHDVYDLPAYVSLAAWHELGEATAVYVEDEDGRRLLVPLILRTLDGDLRDAVSPYGYPGVVTDRPTDAGFVAAAMEAVRATLAEAAVVTMFLRLHPLLPVAGLDSAGTIVWRQTVAVDLGRSADEIWADTRKNHRRDIQKSLRDGAETSFDCDPKCFEEFASLYGDAMERMGASDYYRFDGAYFERLISDLSEHVRLARVLIDGNMAAAGLFTECDGIVEVHLAAADALYAAQRPTKVLVHAIRDWAKDRGDRWLHLGGGRGSTEDSLFHFKAGFSSYRAEFGTLRAVILEDAYRALVGAVAEGADASDLTGYFPRYREATGAAANKR